MDTKEIRLLEFTIAHSQSAFCTTQRAFLFLVVATAKRRRSVRQRLSPRFGFEAASSWIVWINVLNCGSVRTA